MKVQKMVSLDPETAAYATQMTNFSGWVRRMLILRHHGDDAVDIYRRLTALMSAINTTADDETLLNIFKQFDINREQKRLGEFE